MEAKSIKDYAKIMKEMELSALEISEANGVKVRLERNIAKAPATLTPVAMQAINAVSAATQAAAFEESGVALAASDKKVSINNLVPITSPMVGVFYASSSEGAAPFVTVGDRIKKGDVLCVIEAMKLMNEITAEEDGVIAEVCANNGQVVDFGYVLFKISKERS